MSKKVRKKLSSKEQHRRSLQSGKVEIRYDPDTCDVVQFTKGKDGYEATTIKRGGNK